jgi:hypothetical protein
LQDELKQQAAWKAVEYVKSGMKIGAPCSRRAFETPTPRGEHRLTLTCA